MNYLDPKYLRDLKIPENYIIVEWSPQIEVLKRSDVYVSHGGYNSSMEAV